MGAGLIIAGASVAVVGVALFLAAFLRRGAPAMTREQREWVEAESAYRGGIRAAKQRLEAVIREHDHLVQEAGQRLSDARSAGQAQLASLADVDVFENRVRVGDVVFPYSEGPVEASVELAGAGAQTGDGGTAGRATLVVSSASRSAIVHFPHDEATDVAKLATTITTASERWPEVAERAASAVAEATAAVEAAKAARDGAVAAAREAHKRAKADTATVDAARAEVNAAYCPSCGTNVALDSKRGCPDGHTTGIRKFDRSCLKPVIAAFPKRPNKVVPALVVALGVALVIAGLAVGPAGSPDARPTVSQDPDTTASPAPPSPGEDESPDEPRPEEPSMPQPSEPRPPAGSEAERVEDTYRLSVIEVNTQIAEHLDQLTRHLVDARYDDPAWVSATKGTLSGMRATAQKAREIEVPSRYSAVHEAWMEGIESYDWAAVNLAIAIEGPDYALMERCTARLEDASMSLRRATALLQQME